MKVVSAFAAITLLLGWLQIAGLMERCDQPPDIVAIELAFTAARFEMLLKSGAPDSAICARNVAQSFLGWDMPFAPAYALLLASVFLWAERWRGAPQLAAARSRLRDLYLLAPLLAGALDWLENIALALAAQPLLAAPVATTHAASVQAAVRFGSSAALGKWLLLLFIVVGCLHEVVARFRGKAR